MVTPQARVGKICILDDDPSILRSLKELLSSDDFEAEVFDSYTVHLLENQWVSRCHSFVPILRVGDPNLFVMR